MSNRDRWNTKDVVGEGDGRIDLPVGFETSVADYVCFNGTAHFFFFSLKLSYNSRKQYNQ